MGWFSKSGDDFFLATIVPDGNGARDAAIEDMKAAAKSLGADGIVGIDFDYEVLGENNGMMMVSVSGTAVKMA